MVGERQALFERLDACSGRDLLVLDRGYPGSWLVAVLLARGVPFCMRCDSSSSFKAVKAFMHAGQEEAIVTLPAPNRADAADYGCPRQPSTVRLIRQVTPEGKLRVLMTSLLDRETYPATAFADLYHRRWRIEEAFKHRLDIEHTSWLAPPLPDVPFITHRSWISTWFPWIGQISANQRMLRTCLCIMSMPRAFRSDVRSFHEK